MRTRSWVATLTALPLLLAGVLPAPAVTAAAPVQVILDGRTLTLDPAPTIVDDRTLVPLRGLFEAMGANLTWNNATRTVEVTRGDRYIRLKIDRRLACLDLTCSSAATLDVPAKLIQDRTFVPVRFISQTLGAHVSWDDARRAVVIDTTQAPEPQPAPVSITSPLPGQVLTGPTELKLATDVAGTNVQYYLLDPATGSGPMAAAGMDPKAVYTYTPDPGDAGLRLLVAGVRDSAGVMRYSDPVPVSVNPDTAVTVTGAAEGGLVDGPISFSSDVKFVATQVYFNLIDPATGAKEKLGTVGPGDKVTWYPQIGHNGTRQVQAVAVDRYDREYPSAPVTVSVQSGYRQDLSGLKNGQVLKRPVTLSVGTNYSVEAIQYLLDDKHLAWGTKYDWNFGPEASGSHTLRVRITAKDGTVNEIGPISFTVDARPEIWTAGIGPNQVVTGAVTLSTAANVPVTAVEYHLLNEAGTKSIALIGRTAPGQSFTWAPKADQAGNQRLMVMARAANGDLLRSEIVNFRVYLGTIYGPKQGIPRSEFLPMASQLSVTHYHETGMSAALKTAQSLLESGSNPYGPIDKYTGQISYNLFGIKGSGAAGSVISNTWEVYNGKNYYVDANFRAYHNIEEGFKDHADLLLTRPWYAPYRAVMSNPVLGAWALRRSGYATDPNYPVKLINLMKQYDMFKLDIIEL